MCLVFDMEATARSEFLLRAHAGVATKVPDDPASDSLRELLDEILQRAQTAWPTVTLATDAFLTHLGRHLSEELPILEGLRQIHSSDLYLAYACSRGDRNAILAFESQILNAVDTAVSRYRVSSDLVTEVKQRVRERALVSGEGAPRIDGFSGRGDLRGWVRVLAVREALQLTRHAQRELSVAADDERLHAFVTPGDAELEHAKARYRDEFAHAFDAALRGLPAREQTLLRQHVLDGLTVDQLGALYRVHRSTAARSLERARQAVLAATRTQLMARLQVRPGELDSILRLIRSRLEVTLRGLMGRRRKSRA